MRLRLLAAVGCALVATLAVPPAALAAPSCAGLPKHSNLPVVDAARVLDAQKAAYLTGDLMAFAQTSKIVVVAATVPDLGGDDVSSYTHRLFDCWGVGDAASDNGVLIVVAMRERRVRIELGRGVTRIDEEELDRAIAAMTAPLRAGNVVGALRAAALEIAEAVDVEFPDIEHFVQSGTDDGSGFGLPPIPGLPTSAPGDDAVDGFPGIDGSGGVPVATNPFRIPSGGSWIPIAVMVVLGGGVLWTFARAAFNGGARLAGMGQTVWRGGFPSFGGNRGWHEPAMLQGGTWSTPSSGDSGSGSGGHSGGSGGSTFGGGSGSGGGASGSW